MLGICLGLQISLDHSEEQDTRTLGIVPGAVRRFRFDRPELKIPHMGWNEVRPVRAHPLLEDIEPGDEFYFVHGYYPVPARGEDVCALTDYETEFASAVGLGQLFRHAVSPGKERPGGAAPARKVRALVGTVKPVKPVRVESIVPVLRSPGLPPC